jgi:hypothetical protein
MSELVWSPLAEQVVERLISEHSPSWTAEIQGQAEYLSTLWIGYDLWSCHFLGIDGQVFVIGENEDDPEAITVHRDRCTVLSHLLWGSKRYPELKELVPERDPDANDCPSPLHDQSLSKIEHLCDQCGGLGWLPTSRD